MKTRNLLTALLCAGAFLISGIVGAQPGSKLRPDETVLLYNDSFEGNVDLVYGKKISYAGFEMKEANGLTGAEVIGKDGNIANISDLARIDLYFPKKPNGQMVVVCPGGGNKIVSSYNEGLYAAEWMLERGITVAVVKYRLPNCHWEIPLTDIQNAFRYCRSNAQQWNVNQIGVMGFSAGGHLAACTTNMFVDDVTRPDFSIVIYPVITFEDGITHAGTKKLLLGEQSVWDNKELKASEWMANVKKYEELVECYSLENSIKENTPPSFIAHCTDDKTVPIENSIRYYRSLVANKIPAEMHIYPTGGHGWGFSSEKYRGKGKDKFAYARDEYYRSLTRWLESLRK